MILFREAGSMSIERDRDRFLASLGGSVFIRQKGLDGSRTRGVVALMHANETSGLDAVHAWLLSGQEPATNVLFWLASVETALVEPLWSKRMLPGRRDLNRCFLPPFTGYDGELAAAALAVIRGEGLEALVDIHNNSGHNPAYGVITRADSMRLQLVESYADLCVHTRLRLGTLIEALETETFPSVVIECGRIDDPAATAIATKGLRDFLTRDDLWADPDRTRGVKVLSHPVRVGIAPGTRLTFDQKARSDFDLTLDLAIDRHNFQVVAAGTTFGWFGRGSAWPFVATDDHGNDISRLYFTREGGILRSSRPMIPVMMTTSAEAALADCLFYLVPLGPTGSGK